jgi:hypothetical protein
MPRPELDKVWVLYLDYEISEHVKVFTTEEKARRWLDTWVEENWEEFGPGGSFDPGIDPTVLFFDESDCWYYLGECEVMEN